MTKTHYKFIGSILVKKDEMNIRLQLAKASDFGGNEDEYRVYYNRRWLDGFYTEAGLSNLINHFFFNAKAKPTFKKGDKVKIYSSTNKRLHEITYISGDPILTIQGKYLVPLVGLKGYFPEDLLEKI